MDSGTDAIVLVWPSRVIICWLLPAEIAPKREEFTSSEADHCGPAAASCIPSLPQHALWRTSAPTQVLGSGVCGTGLMRTFVLALRYLTCLRLPDLALDLIHCRPSINAWWVNEWMNETKQHELCIWLLAFHSYQALQDTAYSEEILRSCVLCTGSILRVFHSFNFSLAISAFRDYN